MIGNDNILELNKVDKAFGGLKILKEVDLTVRRGEKMALIGPNGAGKSTLLNTIGGQGPATGGKVLFRPMDDKGQVKELDITKMNPNDRLMAGVGKSFQVNNLFWQQNILENVLLALYGAEKNNLRMLKVLQKRTDFVEEAHRLLDLIGMWEKREESPTLLSYGEQRLLEMLLAYAAKPQIILLDEPSAGLPTAEVDAFTNTLRKLNGDITMIFVAHDMDLVFNLADSISVLYFGQIIAHGTPDEIKADPKVKEIYLGGEGDTYDDPR